MLVRSVYQQLTGAEMRYFSFSQDKIKELEALIRKTSEAVSKSNKQEESYETKMRWLQLAGAISAGIAVSRVYVNFSIASGAVSFFATVFAWKILDIPVDCALVDRRIKGCQERRELTLQKRDFVEQVHLLKQMREIRN